jgi:hypothetical protein
VPRPQLRLRLQLQQQGAQQGAMSYKQLQPQLLRQLQQLVLQQATLCSRGVLCRQAVSGRVREQLLLQLLLQVRLNSSRRCLLLQRQVLLAVPLPQTWWQLWSSKQLR